MRIALDQARVLVAARPEQVAAQGWNLVYSSPLISLLKRRGQPRGRGVAGPVEYLMRGRIEDVSPRVFLFAQINRANRARWDRTMRAMEVPGIQCCGSVISVGSYN